MIKQIQLRGISRTPSDRLSEDGGLSESLNMYLDTAENAPAFEPKDVTEELGLPADLRAERIFIHKTANYENYIVVQEGKIVAYTPGIEDEEPLLVMELAEGETVNDITSVGNTLVVSTTANLYYILYKDRVYSLLGNKIPFPYIRFTTEDLSVKYPIYGSITPSGNKDAWESAKITKDYWNKDYNNDKLSHSDKFINAFLGVLWNSIETALTETLKLNAIIGGLVLRYSIELYDGSELSSMPILLGNGYKDALTTKVRIYTNEYNSANPTEGKVKEYKGYSYRIDAPAYRINAKLDADFPWDDWADVISSINIYFSKFPISPQNRSMSFITEEVQEQEDNDTYDSNQKYTRTLRLGDKQDVEFISRILENSSITHLVNKTYRNNIPTSSGLMVLYSELKSGTQLRISNLSGVTIETLDLLKDDDMKHYVTSASKIDNYNNQLILIQAKQMIAYDYNHLNAILVDSNQSDTPSNVTYEVCYLIKGQSRDVVVKKKFEYSNSESTQNKIYAFQVFPDSRAYKMIVTAIIETGDTDKIITTKYGEFDMHPHPYLDCAYYYGGIENELVDLCDRDFVSDYLIDAYEYLGNKLVVAVQDNPFIFPLKQRHSFQSKIIGAAVATTALSQGQFGQFPLYVFTEDGIWAMETAADGSFVSQKPLSREVCNNPDSITSIDNAVVFTTDKGVMMIQGSQVMNISPYMNGRHYKPNESALNIIGKQEGYDTFVDVISDDDPFMSFMKDAKVAYDYTGQRLVFISPSNNGFQYVYKIDTQTWHKVAYEGLDLEAPLNSYPECLVYSVNRKEYKYEIKYKGESLLASDEAIKSLIDDLGDWSGLHKPSSVESFKENWQESWRQKPRIVKYAVPADNPIRIYNRHGFTTETLDSFDVGIRRISWETQGFGTVSQQYHEIFCFMLNCNESELTEKLSSLTDVTYIDLYVRLTDETGEDGNRVWDADFIAALNSFFTAGYTKDPRFTGASHQGATFQILGYEGPDFSSEVIQQLAEIMETDSQEMASAIQGEYIRTSMDANKTPEDWDIKVIDEKKYNAIVSLSTVLDAKPDPENPQKVAKGILITRPFDLGMPDVYKSITSIKIRGDFDKGNVKYILQGSNDGRTFYTLNTLRGKSWRMFRIFILADLEPTERISWIDVDFEPRYNNRLR